MLVLATIGIIIIFNSSEVEYTSNHVSLVHENLCFMELIWVECEIHPYCWCQ